MATARSGQTPRQQADSGGGAASGGASATAASGMRAAGRGRGAARSRIDFATILGLVSGFALIITAMVMGGSPGSFFHPPAVLIVLGGTLAVTTISFSVRDIVNTQKVVNKALFRQHHDPRQTATQLLQLSELARKNGPLAIQNVLKDLRQDRFLHKAAVMISDGMTDVEMDRILRQEVEALVSRHRRSAAVLRRAAEVAPAMGLIGTLVGLVQMLGNLNDPSSIGPAMAVALLTTFYGAILANMVFSPLASKLDRNSDDESLIRQLTLVGSVSIARQENPRRLEMLLNTILPPASRISYFD